jgi:SAM-dependent methyltransferase/glycosyltransferase involved in cell wall biosynthesis
MKLRWAFVVDSVPFSRAVRDGETSLGGSESACLGVARALARRGHAVHIFATQLSEDAEGQDADGCYWHPYESIHQYSALFHWDVFVGLRMPKVFNQPIRARYRVLWNQDLMNAEQFKTAVMSVAWAFDASMYVSDFHRQQWEEWVPELKPMAWVTRNGFDPTHVPTDAVKDPNRIIHISRPERGLAPLMEMWPAFKKANPHATLQICRYSSMYDAQGWGQVCAEFDRDVQRVNAEVGGIEYLGELNKAQLYKAIAEAAVMWYPGVPAFAETSCIAAIEAQACGTPFVGSFKGALPETVPSGYLVRGDAFTPEYQRESMAFVADLLEGCKTNSKRYRMAVQAGLDHVTSYTYDAIAAEWDAHIVATFTARYEGNKLGVLRALMHEDDMMSASLVVSDIVRVPNNGRWDEAFAASELIDRVIKGEDHDADDYTARSMDPIEELGMGNRVPLVVEQFEGCKNVLDVACGNGTFALALALKYPDMHITAVDFAPGNIEKAKAAAEKLGLTDQITFICDTAWDFKNQEPSGWLEAQSLENSYDGLFVGEFIEHVADCTAFIDEIEQVCAPDAKVVYTCPSGPIGMEWAVRGEALRRSHVHSFQHDDLIAVWSGKKDVQFQYLPGNISPVGTLIGGWLITYRVSDAKAGKRPHADRILKTRPRLTLSVGIIAHNAEHDLGRCLAALWHVADEIIVADCGSQDGTRKVAEEFGRKVRVLDLPHVNDFEDGFAGARNAVLKEATGDWFLWIDTDEVLLGTQALRAYLETGGAFIGYALKQNHLQLDAAMHFDTPVRIFRTNQPIQFYGCIHEQPQQGDCNGDIHPALQLEEVQIAHFGYLSQGIRRQKAYARNRPLLVRDMKRFPERRLGKVLWLRQLQQDGDELARTNPNDPRIRMVLQQCVALFRKEFADPADKFHAIARPFYEAALQSLHQGYEVELAIAGKAGGLDGKRAKPARMWVADAEEMEAVLKHRTGQIVKQMSQVPVRVEPFIDEPVNTEAVPV